MTDIDESYLSEIAILSDGRVYAFGITRSMTELLNSLQRRPDEAVDLDHATGEVRAVENRDSSGTDILADNSAS